MLVFGGRLSLRLSRLSQSLHMSSHSSNLTETVAELQAPEVTDAAAIGRILSFPLTFQTLLSARQMASTDLSRDRIVYVFLALQRLT